MYESEYNLSLNIVKGKDGMIVRSDFFLYKATFVCIRRPVGLKSE